ncbi:hypothetical protein PAMP_023710 [Pampus punctatissimus]
MVEVAMETGSLLPADIIYCCTVVEQAHEYLRFMDTERRMTHKTAASLYGPPPPAQREIQRVSPLSDFHPPS